MVGAVLVRRGKLVAQGHHPRYGGIHAEAAVLRRAGDASRGATLYVNLEPCAHHGKTPPCADAIARAGVRKVVAAMKDPHALVNGRGLRRLRSAGIEVKTGLLAAEARKLNEAYLTALKLGRPLVTLKAGLTLDGRIATASGESRWITSAVSRRDAHRLRAEHDAVLVGAGTALHDRPCLNARHGARGIRQPMRVVLDSNLRLDPESPLLEERGGGALLIYTGRRRGDRTRRLEDAGARVVAVSRGDGGLDLESILSDLVGRGVHCLLVEGGSRVAWSFLSQGLADRIAFYMAPLLLGGERSIPVVGGQGPARLSEGVRISGLQVRPSGPDLLVTGRILSGGGARSGPPRSRPRRGASGASRAATLRPSRR
jgi:diaminohydroxyphosphoribosylaminopyrimidine deaminase/5-amino-6-(5-phosphoribosylamino)uracil reductase